MKYRRLKNKGGRPKEKVADKVDLVQIEKLAGLGLTDAEIGYVVGVTERTINNWKKDEGFLSALKRGKVKADIRVVESLFKLALGYKYTEKSFEAIKCGNGEVTKHKKVKAVVKEIPPNVTASIFWLKNRQPKDWREVKESANLPQEPEEIDAVKTSNNK